MNYDVDEYLQGIGENINEDADIFIDEKLIEELLRIPHKPGTGGAYWSLYKIGKNPNIFKDPKLKKENFSIGKGEVFVDYEHYFDTHNSLSKFLENE